MALKLGLLKLFGLENYKTIFHIQTFTLRALKSEPLCEQGSEELQLSADHIKQIICILRDFIHSPERRVMAATISKLKLDLDFDSTSINQIQLVLFGFQDSVSTNIQTHVNLNVLQHVLDAVDVSLPIKDC